MLHQILGLYGAMTGEWAPGRRGTTNVVRSDRSRSSLVVFEPPAGLTSTTAVGINNSGQVAVGCDDGVLLWERGAYTYLGAGTPTAINGGGRIVGIMPGGVTVFRKGHRPQPLNINMIPAGFNDEGSISGYARPHGSGCASHALLWHDGQLATLAPSPQLSDRIGARALGMNNRGEVVGTTEAGSTRGPTHALFWRDGRVVDLGRFGGDHAAARGINDRGQVIVTSYSEATGLARSFLVDDERVIAIGPASRRRGEHVGAINNRGDVIGDNGDAPFLWRNGVLTDLRTMVPAHASLTIVAARDINDDGMIVGHGYDIFGNSRGFLLRPGD